jgi:hypothetical protein
VSNKQFWILLVEAFVYLDAVLAQIILLAHLIAIEAIVQQLNTIEIVNNDQKNGLFVVGGQTTCCFFWLREEKNVEQRYFFLCFGRRGLLLLCIEIYKRIKTIIFSTMTMYLNEIKQCVRAFFARQINCRGCEPKQSKHKNKQTTNQHTVINNTIGVDSSSLDSRFQL